MKKEKLYDLKINKQMKREKERSDLLQRNCQELKPSEGESQP